MANINIYGTLFNNLSKNNEKVIVLGSQVYGNKPDQSSTATAIYDETDSTRGWTSGLVVGNQYDINKFFKAELTNINNTLKDEYVPYVNAKREVDLGTNFIISSAFGLTTPKAPASIDNEGKGLYLLTNRSTKYNCVDLYSIFHNMNMNWSFIDDESLRHLTLYDVIDYIHYKVNHITNPLRFKGVINSGGKLPGLNEGVEVGDVWHFNADISPYYEGDEVVCTAVTSTSITWELLGQNITPIPTGSITFENLESN